MRVGKTDEFICKKDGVCVVVNVEVVDGEVVEFSEHLVIQNL